MRMKSRVKWGSVPMLALACGLALGMKVSAQGDGTIKNGIFAGDIDLSGLSGQEASQAVEAYVEGLKSTEITLLAAADTEVVVTAEDLGVAWSNPELVEEALEVGTRGNVIERDRKSVV